LEPNREKRDEDEDEDEEKKNPCHVLSTALVLASQLLPSNK
jgi:hypothetical protein